MSNSQASVIVLAWNGIEYLGPCLHTVLAQDCADFEVIVVDNGSTDGSADFVARQYPHVLLIRNESNLGFAAGNNIGLQAATGDPLVLLNQDTKVHPGWLTELVNTVLTGPDIGIAGGKALYPDGTIQHAGGVVGKRGQGQHYGYRQRDRGQFDQARDVDYVTGASLAITRRALESIGQLDVGFSPAYYEDVDWCYRAREAGFRVVYTPDAVLTHNEASATVDLRHEGMYLQHRNRLRFVLKHWPLNRLLDEFLQAELDWLESLDEGGERLVAAVHHAYLFHLLNLSAVMVWREKLLESPLDEADSVADVLLQLRASIPLKPARIDIGQQAVPDKPSSIPMPGQAGVSAKQRPGQVLLLDRLRQRSTVQEVPFHSRIPALGPLIAAFRRQWNQVSTRWYVLPMIQQQNKFNALVVNVLEQQKYDQRRLAEVLATYIGESGREIAELAQEIQKLNDLSAERPDETD
jgi:GT2 family glycosyltransferase